jgi:hypothetical protein
MVRPAKNPEPRMIGKVVSPRSFRKEGMLELVQEQGRWGPNKKGVPPTAFSNFNPEFGLMTAPHSIRRFSPGLQ